MGTGDGLLTDCKRTDGGLVADFHKTSRRVKGERWGRGGV